MVRKARSGMDAAWKPFADVLIILPVHLEGLISGQTVKRTLTYRLAKGVRHTKHININLYFVVCGVVHDFIHIERNKKAAGYYHMR